jgi:hypothetical protein
MAIKVNGTEITTVKVNGTEIDKVMVGTVKVFERKVPATGWSILGAGNYDYVASFEETSFLVDTTRLGCGFYISDLPSASLYLVVDIVRGRLNPASGGTCDTWVYYEAVIDNKKWVYIGVSTSQSGYTPFYQITSSSEQATVELMEQKFPARNYNVGPFGDIQWGDDFYVFQVQELSKWNY